MKLIFLLLSILTLTINCCDSNQGCILFQEYIVSVSKSTSKGVCTSTSQNTYNVMVTTDKVIIIKESSSDSTENAISNEENIIRSIYHSNLILECGPSGDKLCQLGQYQYKHPIPDLITATKTMVPTSPESLCVAVGFYDSSCSNPEDQVLIICEQSSGNISNFLEFKNHFSRIIVEYTLSIRNDRFSAHNSPLAYGAALGAFDSDGSWVSVNGDLFARYISVSKKNLDVDENGELLAGQPKRIVVFEYSNLECINKRIRLVKDCIEIGYMKNGWSSEYNLSQSEDIYNQVCMCFPKKRGGIFIFFMFF